MKENQQLRKRLEEAEKENLFLKKAAAFFAKEVK
jgi:transposase